MNFGTPPTPGGGGGGTFGPNGSSANLHGQPTHPFLINTPIGPQLHTTVPPFQGYVPLYQIVPLIPPLPKPNNSSTMFEARSKTDLGPGRNMESELVEQSPRRASTPPPKIAHIGVFWDIENCSVPTGMSAIAVVQKIRDTFFQPYVEAEFVTVCDIRKEKGDVIKELNEAQVTVIHVPATSKNAADDKLRQAMRRYADAYSPLGRSAEYLKTHGTPAVLLISSDVNFAGDLSDLRYRKRLHVILLHSRQCHESLICCAHEHYDFKNGLKGVRSRGSNIHWESLHVGPWRLGNQQAPQIPVQLQQAVPVQQIPIQQFSTAQPLTAQPTPAQRPRKQKPIPLDQRSLPAHQYSKLGSQQQESQDLQPSFSMGQGQTGQGQEDSQQPEKWYEIAVYNLPLNESKTAIENRLRRLSDNCGGKVRQIFGHVAIIRFSGRDAAMRASKRMRYEHVCGSRIETTGEIKVYKNRHETAPAPAQRMEILKPIQPRVAPVSASSMTLASYTVQNVQNLQTVAENQITSRPSDDAVDSPLSVPPVSAISAPGSGGAHGSGGTLGSVSSLLPQLSNTSGNAEDQWNMWTSPILKFSPPGKSIKKFSPRKPKSPQKIKEELKEEEEEASWGDSDDLKSPRRNVKTDFTEGQDLGATESPKSGATEPPESGATDSGDVQLDIKIKELELEDDPRSSDSGYFVSPRKFKKNKSKVMTQDQGSSESSEFSTSPDREQELQDGMGDGSRGLFGNTDNCAEVMGSNAETPITASPATSLTLLADNLENIFTFSDELFPMELKYDSPICELARAEMIAPVSPSLNLDNIFYFSEEFFKIQEQPPPEPNRTEPEPKNNKLLTIVTDFETFSAQVKSILTNASGSMEVNSFCDAYQFLYEFKQGDENEGVPIEHLLHCVQGVEVKFENGGKWVRFVMTCDLGWDLEAGHDPEWRQLKIQIVNLLKLFPRCTLELSQVPVAYQAQYGRPLVPDTSSVQRSIKDLFMTNLRSTVHFMGNEPNLFVTLTHEVQMKRFAVDVLRILKARNMKLLQLKDFSAVYLTVIGHEFEGGMYGMCSLTDLLKEMTQRTGHICLVQENGGTSLSLL